VKPLLAQENAHLLGQLASPQALLAFDFDGTLAPIVAHREEAHMRPRTRSLFALVCERFACAVISGRSRSDVGQRLAGAQVKYVIGNHGLEAPQSVLAWHEEMQDVRARLESALTLVPGVDVEDKGFSLTIHYRRATAKRGARMAIRAAVAALPYRLRTIPGKLVVNLVPADAPHKGDALLQTLRETGAQIALYVGDDVTDEDVFLLNPNPGIVGVRIGVSKTSAAGFYLRDQREIDALLTRLLALSSTPSA
jgi:trehalose 6-phosphate phosphatase